MPEIKRGNTAGSLVLADDTTDNVTSALHGFAPKSPGDATQFLNGAATPGYAQPKDSDLATTDVTTNDVTTAKHGFVPKAPNSTSKFLRGDGSWAVQLASRQELHNTGRGIINENLPYIYGIAANVAPTAGTIYGVTMGLRAGDALTNIVVATVTAGTSTAPTLIRLGIADSGGVVRAITADLHSSAIWTSAQRSVCPITGGYTVPSDGTYWLLFIQVGSWAGTAHTMARGTAPSTALAAPLSGKLGEAGTFGTAQSDLPGVSSSLAATTYSNTSVPFWMAVS